MSSADSIDDAAAMALVLQRHDLEAIAPPARIAGGTLNRNYLVRVRRCGSPLREPTQALVLRRIRDDQSDDAIRNEHETLAWVHERGLPVVCARLPLDATPREEGDRLPATCLRLELSGGDAPDTRVERWAAFDFVEGKRLPRHQLTPRTAAALGEIHGRTQALLANHPRSADARFTMRWSKDASLQQLAEIRVAAVRVGAPASHLDAIDMQTDMLRGSAPLPPEHFFALPCQWLHGDFHDQQVLFDDDDEIRVVLDWELCQPGARVWELVRSLAFSGLLERAELRDYLASYLRHVDLGIDELRLGLALWWQSRIVGAWVWWAGYVQGNERVLPLVPDTIVTLRKLATPGWQESVTQRILDVAVSAGARAQRSAS